MHKAPPTLSPDGRSTTGLKLNSIQYLRAFAAASVVLSHAANALLGRNSHLIDLDYGAYGVDIFFVVSGFIMFYTTFETGMRPSAFLVKRLIRIFPLYFILSTVMYIMVVASPASFNRVSGNSLAYLESILFIPHWNPNLHVLQPILGPGWTLNYEMFFYLLFAASLFLRSRLNGIAVVPAIGALVIFGHYYPVDSPMFITYTNPLMLEFCLGILVSVSFVVPATSSLRWPTVLIGLLTLGTAYFYCFHGSSFDADAVRPVSIGLPCALLVAVSVVIERCGRLPNVAFLAFVGDASYSLYLVHTFVLGFGQRLWRHFVASDSILSHAFFVTFILVASIGVALIVYRCLELKIGRKLSSAVLRRQTRFRRAVGPDGMAVSE